ncbi:hypothetical protein KP509_33G015700 [Ceratopteris richardii]|nr:hypothetical protein KP509_33G015700 [Ceratopteris richardii]
MGIWHKGHGTNRKNDFLKGVFPGWAQIYSEKRLGGSFSTDSLVEVLLSTLVLTVALSIPFIFGFLWLLKTFARQLVFSCLPFFILVPAFLDVFWFVACLLSSECQESFSRTGQISLFIFIAILCGIFAWIIYSNRDHIELTIRMMQASAQALFSNWMLLIVLPGLSLVFFVYLGPFVVLLIYGYMNGEIVGTPGTYCQGESATDCCTWSVGKWVPLYYIVTIFTVLWSILLMTQVQVYIISSTIAQWYFAMSKTKVTGRIWCSFKNVFGPSFGTVTFSGLIVSFVSMIRALLDSTSVDDQQGFFATMLQRFVRFTLVSIEFLNRFTISFAAITGESYCHSARLSYELLKRNLLSPVLLEVISTQLLTGMAFILTVVYAIVVLIILKAGMSLGSVAYYVTALAWFLLFVMFLLFCQVLNNTIDTLYICYAIDKDSGNFPTMEVLDIYTMLPVSRDQSRALVAQQV